MIDVGHFCLVLALLLAVYGAFIGLWGAKTRNSGAIHSAQNALVISGFCALSSLAGLAWAFLSHDYRYLYVWQNSNNDMHPIYLVSAIWGGMDGSMLLWASLMSAFAAVVILRTRTIAPHLLAWAAPVLGAASSFFLFLTVFLTNPFRFHSAALLPSDGNGLNPLLQNPSMFIHPPLLYLGFTGFAVPFAFSLGALLSGNLSAEWTYLVRRWTLVAWLFLTSGIILGGHWAYIELGWGGFWAWDPVENSSFLPWLTGTAFLHSVMVQQRRGMLRFWNAVLSVLTYGLTVFGTFLTRSGIVQSVHAFAETDIGWVFLLYLFFIALISITLIFYRRSELRPENRLESYFSREAVFLFNNLFLLAICFATFWGVMFPVFSEAFSGEKSVVGPPFFNAVNVPLFLVLLFLMGVGPLIAWRSARFSVLRKLFAKSFLLGSLLCVLFLWLDPARPLAAISFGLSLFVISTIVAEFHRGVLVRRELTSETNPVALAKLIAKKPRRYGGLIVHFGVAIMAVAITASMAYKIEKDLSMVVGESIELGSYRLELKELHEGRTANYQSLQAEVSVFSRKSGALLGALYPEKRHYFRSQESTTEVDMRVSPREDLYLALAGIELDEGQPLSSARVAFKVFVNPLQVWLWFGALLMLGGTVLTTFVQVHAPGRVKESLSAKDETSEALA